MKRLLIIPLLWSLLSASSQVRVSLIGGGTATSLSFKNNRTGYQFNSQDNLRNNNKIKTGYSFFVGTKFDFAVTSNLSLSSKFILEDLRFVEKVNNTITSVYPNRPNFQTMGKDAVDLLYLSIPLHIVFYAPLKTSRLYVGVGGYVSYGLLGSSDFKLSSSNDPEVRDSISAITFSGNEEVTYAKFHANRFDYGLSVMAGIEFRNGLFFELGYDNGLKTILTDRYLVRTTFGTNVQYGYRNKRREFKLGIGYRLN